MSALRLSLAPARCGTAQMPRLSGALAAEEGKEVKALHPKSLIQAVRIAAKMADNDPQRNADYVEAMELMATALESAKVSSRNDGDYWLVRIPEPGKKPKGK